jgi:hypothetical protein
MLHKYNGLEKEGGWAEGLYTTVQHFFGAVQHTSIKGVSGMKKNNFFFEQKTP